MPLRSGCFLNSPLYWLVPPWHVPMGRERRPSRCYSHSVLQPPGCMIRDWLMRPPSQLQWQRAVGGSATKTLQHVQSPKYDREYLSHAFFFLHKDAPVGNKMHSRMVPWPACIRPLHCRPRGGGGVPLSLNPILFLSMELPPSPSSRVPHVPPQAPGWPSLTLRLRCGGPAPTVTRGKCSS